MHALSTFPADGAGTDCGPDAPDDCGVPVDAPIEIRFDRYLLPKTAIRQSLHLHSGPRELPPLSPVYDVLERVVSYRLPGGGTLEPGLLYEVELVLPAKSKNGFGFRAFDGEALVDHGPVPLHFSFRTARNGPASQATGAATTCADALSIFQSACVECHGTSRGDMGLRLDSGASLRETALSRAAREVEGPRAGESLVDAPRFGVGMPLIDPGSPGGSYLVYKLLTNPENFGPGPAACQTTHRVSLPQGVCPRAPEEERVRLEDWFVRLDPMPPEGRSLAGGLLDLRTLDAFIRAGASTEGCD